jgi:lipopolysaccharide/colanic/teichoic acid biosynthesis glycosyltransferase
MLFLPETNDFMQSCLKRIFDIVFSLISVLLLSPLLLIIAIVVKSGSRGPVIFKQSRAGKDRKSFVLYKFRTMKVDADPFGRSPKDGNDSRLIAGGRFVREYSLDELPQLFNVLKGDMSLIGPRPLYMSQINEMDEHYERRSLVKPGLTGLSQLYSRSELTAKANLDLDIKYVEEQNLWLDIKIIFLTLIAVISKKGVYEK